MASVTRLPPSGSRYSAITRNRQRDVSAAPPNDFRAEGVPSSSLVDRQAAARGQSLGCAVARTPPPSPRRALRGLRSPGPPVLSDEAFATWRRQEVSWLRSALDTVTALLPDDVELEPTIHASDALILDDEADEALMTTHLDKFSRRLMWKAALSKDGDDGNAEHDNDNPVSPSGPHGHNWLTSTPVGADAPQNLFNSKSLTRLFTSVRVLQDRNDVGALQLAARLVDRMLSLRKPRTIRLLLRNFLDDVMMVLRQIYPSLSRRRACAFVHNDDFPHLPPGDDRFRTLSKLSRHLAAIEDLTDALIPPCDDTTYCGLQEFSERLSAMVSIEIARCKLIPHACTAIRRAREADPPRPTQPLWDMVHESVGRLGAFIACHCDGDDEDSASDSDSGGNSSSAPCSGKQVQLEGDSWRYVLREAVEESKLLGVICEALQNADEGVLCRRRAATILRCMTQDSETLPLLQDACVRYDRVWEYLIPSLVDDDAAVRLEVGDAVAALLGDGRDSCVEHGAALRDAIVGPFSSHVLASMDIGTESLTEPVGAPSRRSAGSRGVVSSSSLPHPPVATDASAVLAIMGTVLLVVPSAEGCAAFVAFHQEAVALAVRRIQSAVLLDVDVRRRNGAPTTHGSATASGLVMAPYWRRHQVAVIGLLQYIRSVVRVFAGRVDGKSNQAQPLLLPPLERAIPVATQHTIVQTILTMMEDTRQRRGACGGCLLVGVCAELLTALKK